MGNIGCKSINLIGGELFLHKDWDKIVTRLRENNIDVSIITNGIALTEDKIKFLKDSGVISIGISVDGGTAETNDYIRQVPGLFNKILETTEILAKYNLFFGAITTLNKINIFELPIMRRVFANSKFIFWQTQIASSHGRMIENLAIDPIEYYISALFYSKSKQIIPDDTLTIVCGHDFGYFSNVMPRHTSYKDWIGCPAGISIIGIRGDGKIHGCLSAYCDEFIEDDVRKRSLKEIWLDENFCNWNSREQRTAILCGFCKECQYGETCLGGCTDTAFVRTGSIGENTHCYHKIETEWKNIIPKNDFEKVFKGLTQGQIGKNGELYLESGELLIEEYLNKQVLSDYERNSLIYL